MEIQDSGQKSLLFDEFKSPEGLAQILSGFWFSHAPHQWNELGPTIKCFEYLKRLKSFIDLLLSFSIKVNSFSLK